MDGNVVTVTVAMKAKSGLEERLRGVLKGMIGPSRSEEGCLEYHIYQSLIEPLDFLLYQRWRDQASYERHLNMLQIRQFDEIHAKELLIRPYSLERWIPVELQLQEVEQSGS